MRDDHSKPRLRIVTRMLEATCERSEQETRRGSDKLLPLHQGAAYLSSRFQSDRALLPAEGQARVNSMIDLFFEPGIGTHVASPSPTRRAMRRFVCPIGTIYYFQSREHEAPVMQCFVLHGPGGGGGTHAGLPLVPSCLGGRGQEEDEQPVERRIAAHFDDLLQHTAAEQHFTIYALWLTPGANATRTARGRRRARAHLRGERLLGQIAKSCRALCVRPDPAALPPWSLLGDGARVAEQLENDFARAIFAGEAVSHLGRSLSLFSDEGRGVDHWRRRRAGLRATPLDPRMLYEETLRVLRAIHRRSEEREWARCQYFVSLSFADDNPMGDMRCLSVVRSEMIFHFSTILSEYSARKRKDVAYRYAKFAYFTEISKDFFGLREGSYPVSHLIDDCQSGQRSEKWMSSELVRNIDEFGHMSASIVEHLLGESDEQPDKVSEFDRLCELASQILLEERSIDVITFDGSPSTE